MTLCLCGCGVETTKGKTYIRGHWQRCHASWNKGIVTPIEVKNKIAISNTGRKLSEFAKRKIGEANSKRIIKDETKMILSLKNTGYKHTEGAKQKIRQAVLGKPSHATGFHHTEEQKHKFSTWMTGRKHISKEGKIKISNRMKMQRLQWIIPSKDTIIERLVQQELDRRNIKYVKHYPIVGQPDIVFPDKKIAIFLDGCYWHADPRKYMFDYMVIRDVTAEDIWKKDDNILMQLAWQGWTVRRYWEDEIKKNPVEIVDRIEKLLG